MPYFEEFNRMAELVAGITYPKWHHKYSWDAAVNNKSTQRELRIENERTLVTVTVLSETRRGEKAFNLKYYIYNTFSKIQGKVEFTKDQLLRAFDNDRTEQPKKASDQVMKNFDVTDASQGIFARHGEYLNIPGPGSGAYGDANVSLLVTNEMKDLVREFVEVSK